MQKTARLCAVITGGLTIAPASSCMSRNLRRSRRYQISRRPAYHCEARYGYAWVALDDPLAPIFDASEENDPRYRRIPQFYEVWNTSPLRLMENSFDNAHFAFVHQGTFGQISQPLPEKYEINETDYGFEAETIITVANPPAQHRIAGTTATATKRHMRNRWYMPFTASSTLSIHRGSVMSSSTRPRRSTTTTFKSCSGCIATIPKLIVQRRNWSTGIIRSLARTRRSSKDMASDRPGIIMRRRLSKLLEDHGEMEVSLHATAFRYSAATLRDSLSIIRFSIRRMATPGWSEAMCRSASGSSGTSGSVNSSTRLSSSVTARSNATTFSGSMPLPPLYHAELLELGAVVRDRVPGNCR